MQLEYGFASNCNGDGTANYRYITTRGADPERATGPANRAGALNQTARAVAVKITLLMRAHGINRDSLKADENGSLTSRYRREFSTVVELRNGCST